jgi:hypothetical protein
MEGWIHRLSKGNITNLDHQEDQGGIADQEVLIDMEEVENEVGGSKTIINMITIGIKTLEAEAEQKAEVEVGAGIVVQVGADPGVWKGVGGEGIDIMKEAGTEAGEAVAEAKAAVAVEIVVEAEAMTGIEGIAA